MSNNVLTYFRPYSREMPLVFTAIQTVPVLPQGHEDVDRRLFEIKKNIYDYYVKINYDKVYQFTITSRYKTEEKIKDKVKLYLSVMQGNFDYVILPAYQESGRLHYHGLMAYVGNDIVMGKEMYGYAQKIYVEEIFRRNIGRTDVTLFRKGSKMKCFDYTKSLENYLDYVFSERNYLGCLGEIITNIENISH